jgi:hypothetical protein
MSWFDMRGRNLLREKILRIVCLECLRKASGSEGSRVRGRTGVNRQNRGQSAEHPNFSMPDQPGSGSGAVWLTP